MPPMPDPKCFPLSHSVPAFQTCDKLPRLTQLEATAPEIMSGGLLRLRAIPCVSRHGHGEWGRWGEMSEHSAHSLISTLSHLLHCE